MFIKKICGYTDYLIHRNGFVISFKYSKPRILKPGISKKGKGYDYVNLMSGGKYQTEFVHLLVAKHFMEDYDPELEVNHIDGCKRNNNLDNLEMVTRNDNMKHAVKMGLLKTPRHPKLTWDTVREIREKWATGHYTQSELSKVYGVGQKQISNIVNMRYWVESTT